MRGSYPHLWVRSRRCHLLRRGTIDYRGHGLAGEAQVLSMSSAGSGFSPEVTIPEGEERERVGRAPSLASDTSRIASPGGRSLDSSTGARDLRDLRLFDHPTVQTRSSGVGLESSYKMDWENFLNGPWGDFGRGGT